MNILLCNERLLFRFGVDRVLMLLGHGLKDRGHRIFVMANKIDRPIVEGFAEKIIEVPEGDGSFFNFGGSYLNLNEFTAQWLEANWDILFDDQSQPDVALIGGWPFFAAIPVFERLGCRAVFQDHGAVPLDDLDDSQQIIQTKLRNLRKEFLSQSSAIIPVSHFIASSQSCAVAGSCPVEPVLNGADHMALALWDSASSAGNNCAGGATSKIVEKRRGEGVKTILNLGRWEPGCYKNSEALFKLVDAIEANIPKVVVLILADPRLTTIPAHYYDKVVPIGFPSDTELQSIMGQVDLSVSVSLWEGFNLPLAEMQWINKPALAFNIGAHPEVIVHPWFLCQDIAEMARKAIELLSGGGLNRETLRDASETFHADFRWQAVAERYESLLERVVTRHRSIPMAILVDVSNASRDPANSGVIRVTRRLCRELQHFCKPLFVIWGGEDQGYVFPTRAEYSQLSQFNGPVIDDHAPCSPEDRRQRLADAGILISSMPTWLLLTETIMEVNGRQIHDYAKRLDINIGAIFYDAIPIMRSNLVKDTIIRDNHAHYMRGLQQCDLVAPISHFSAQSLEYFWADEGITGCRVSPILLPGEFKGVEREATVEKVLPSEINMLFVSTLEPRKNHRKLIEAVELFSCQHPEIDWSLTLIGNRSAGGEDIAEFVEQACRDNPRIRWLGIVDDMHLHQAYKECTFTVYTSEIEGFGLPIQESLWHGKPCICHDQGVMAEHAAGGGCLTVDVTDAIKLATSIGELATNSSLYAKLVREATTRPIKTWKEYASDFWAELTKQASFSNIVAQQTRDNQTMNIDANHAATPFQKVLYAGCLTKEWQMSDSERLGIAAVLNRLKPKCAIEIGTYRGGSLSLIAQYVDVVFSIDIDSSIPEKYKQFTNVSFFTGPSQVILPTLLQELNNAEIPVEFILIDDDHSAAGVKRDIEIILDYVPKKPLIVMMHGGFNPECRRGMLEADWQKSPYVQYIDIDFIPGRVVEHGGGNDGEMWGGLAIAYFSSAKRVGKVDVGATASRAFEKIERMVLG